MVKKEITKKKMTMKKMTINDLAVMVARGFDDVKKDLRGDMAKMENGIRGDMTKMENGIRGDMVKMETNIRNDFQTKLVDVEDRLTVRINGLEKLIEKKVINFEPGKGELHSLNLRVTKLEKKVGA